MLDSSPATALTATLGRMNMLQVVWWAAIVQASLWIVLASHGVPPLDALFAAWMMSGVTTIGVASVLHSIQFGGVVEHLAEPSTMAEMRNSK